MGGAAYNNLVASGTVTAAGGVSLHFTRTDPDAYVFDAGGTLTGGHFVGWADGAFLWTANGAVTCH